MPGLVVVRWSIVLLQAGYVTSYFIFVPANLQAVLGLAGVQVSTGLLLLLMFCFEAPLILLRNLSSPIIATCTVAAGVGVSVGIASIFVGCVVLLAGSWGTNEPAPNMALTYDSSLIMIEQ